MSTDDITIPEQDAELIDLDDVEGHGLREVAAGLGAAAVLAGGASAAMASTGVTTHLPTVHASTAGISVTVDADAATASSRWMAGDTATQTKDAAQTAASNATQRASATGTGMVADVKGVQTGVTGLATDKVADAKALASKTVSGVTSTVTGAEQTALKTAGNVTSTAKQDVAATRTIAANAEVWAADTATSKASSGVAQAVRTEAATVQSASGAKDSTLAAAGSTVDRKTATVLSATSKTVAGVTTITTNLTALDAGAGVDMDKASGWMTLKAGDVIVAQWQTSGGSSTATVTVPGGTELQLTYTGDNVLAPSARTIIS